MKRYDKYKNSPIPWIGEIPEHWEVKKLKYCIKKIESGKRESTDKSEIYSIGGEHVGVDGKIHLDNPKYVSQEFYDKSSKGKICKNDILIVKDGATIGKTAFVDFDPQNKMIVNEHVYRIKAHKYYYYYFLSWFFQEYIWKENQSSAQEGLPLGTILNIPTFFIPSLNEQSLIANYLDRKTAEIDDLIAKKERLLELYEEEKKAVINKAVTRGIKNEKLKMKNSGIPWLGEIPEHWEVKKLKYVAKVNPSNIDKKSKEGEKEVFLCNYIDVYNNDYIDENINFMKATAIEKQIEKFRLEKGDVIITKDSESPDDIGIPAYVKKDLNNVVCGYHLAHIKPHKILGKYLFRQFQCRFIQAYFEVSANGITRYGLGIDKINSTLILIPPFSEQQQIVSYIENQISIIDSKIEITKKMIELLKEYKTSLISEVVTGKRKVV